jgi:hypothetical protein
MGALSSFLDEHQIANSLTDKRERNLDCGRVTGYSSITT